MFPEFWGSRAEMLNGVAGGGGGVEYAVKLSPVWGAY